MPIDLQKITQKKDRIISTLQLKGPSLPIHISKSIEEPPLFTSAYLSELSAKQKIKFSAMRIGSSALYYLPGQESMLESFIDSLSGREKEAALMLKNDKLLEDDSLSPVMRVALRAIKDFAIPVRIRLNNDSKLFWKYFLVNDSSLSQLYESKKSNLLAPEIKQIPQSVQIPESKLALTIPDIKSQEVVLNPQSFQKQEVQQKTEEKKLKMQKEKKEKKPKTEDLKFANNVKEYLSSKDIELVYIIEQKKKEFSALVRLDTLFGKQDFYLIAKDKKKIFEEELILAHHKAEQQKMPALILAPGEIDKKAAQHASVWKNLVKFERVKL